MISDFQSRGQPMHFQCIVVEFYRNVENNCSNFQSVQNSVKHIKGTRGREKKA